jgi:glycosyltransferase involved in cell wall biosynthesis
MRAAHLSKVKGIAGSERHLLTLLPGLRARGVETTMIVLEEPENPADDFCAAMSGQGVAVERVPVRGDLDPGLTGRLARVLHAAAPDIAHTHLIHADLYGLPAARRAGVPGAVSSRHNDNPFRRRPLIRMANRWAMRRADRVIAISGALADFVRRVEGVPAEKVVTVRYGLDPLDYPSGARAEARASFDGRDGEALIGYFGRLIAQKGVDTLLAAFANVRQDHPSARLAVVGDGDRRAALEVQAAALGLNEAVTFAGWVADAACLMPGCEVVAMPSRWEGFGLVALEAMSASRPLVASRVSALPEIVVDGETGLLVPPDDPAALAAALNALLADPARAEAMGRAGRARLVERFSVDRMIRETLAVYEAVLDGVDS